MTYYRCECLAEDLINRYIAPKTGWDKIKEEDFQRLALIIGVAGGSPVAAKLLPCGQLGAQEAALPATPNQFAKGELSNCGGITFNGL